MRYLFIVFQGFRMCFFDNGLQSVIEEACRYAVTCEHSSISITTFEDLLHSARSIDEIKHVPQCRKSTPRLVTVEQASTTA